MRRSSGRGGGGGGGGGVGGGAVPAASLAALLCSLVTLAGGAAAQRPRVTPTYKTLSGDAPLIIAQGGFSGIFPDSSYAAYAFVVVASAADTISWCNVQLTKDGVGICLRDINMHNCTNVPGNYPARRRTYVIDGVNRTGWFPMDFTMTELQTQSVGLTQAIFSRPPSFDTQYSILSVTDLPTIVNSSPLWLNVQRDIFYEQHGLNMRNYILSIQKRVIVNYISSPELGFLQSIARRVGRKTKLVFRFLDQTRTDPSTNLTYGSLLNNLTFIKTIASGIMLPKSYIWPVTSDNYLQPEPHTSVVTEAHNAGLEVYAADFANDRVIPYNYSYDPLEEYLSFVSIGGFSVDGVLSDFPITASEAIGCFVNLNSTKVNHENPLVISHNGASGDFPDCTDLAYRNAIQDGADVIDCPIQVTSDGVLVCMSSVNLLDTTNVQQTPFSSLASVVSEIQHTPGIFTFNITWDNFTSSNLTPKISSPLSTYILSRNPRYTNQGKFIKLSDFLEIGKHKDLSGVMIILENAAFLASSLGFDIVDKVNTALSDAGYNNQTSKEVMVRSSDSAVLVKLKQQKTNYKLVYTLRSGIGDASPSALAEMKKFADAVVVDKTSVFALSGAFVIRKNNLVNDLQSVGLDVYVQVFRNEFVSQPWDYFGDATVEINNYVQLVNATGYITDFPKTISTYKKNSCTRLGNNIPSYMQYLKVGSLAELAKPPAMPPMPTLNASSVEEPPLPPVAPKSNPGGTATPGTSPNSDKGSSDAHAATVNTSMLLAMVFVALLI